MIVHIRNRIRRPKGYYTSSGYYRSPPPGSGPESSAVCGGAMTDQDLGYPRDGRELERQASWHEGRGDEVCSTCRTLVDGRQGRTDWAARRRRKHAR